MYTTMSDFLIDNKTVYDFQFNFIKYFSYLVKIIAVLYITGFLQIKPPFIIELNYFIKIILALFLMYRFNKYRENKIKFTELDRKICYSAGLYILLISFADFINEYIEAIRSYLIRYNFIVNNSIYTKMKNY